jgi:hypothetical protein
MFNFKVHAREQENTIVLLGIQPMQPMSPEEARKLGHALIDAYNGVAVAQAKLHGQPSPALDTVPSYEVPDIGSTELAPPAPPPPTRGRRQAAEASAPEPAAAPAPARPSHHRRQAPQNAHQGAAGASHQAAGTDYSPTDAA